MKKSIYILFLLLSLFASTNCKAQGKEEVMQFSGLVVSGDSLYGIPGAFIYVPTSGRGTTSDYYGKFSFPLLAGDTVNIKAIGYKIAEYVVPYDTSKQHTALIYIQEDTATYAVIDIDYIPTEQEFREAFMALNTVEEEISNMRKNLNDQIMARLLLDADMDASLNYSYYMNQQQYHLEHENEIAPMTRLLDPFAWARVFQAFKEQKERKQKEKELERNN